MIFILLLILSFYITFFIKNYAIKKSLVAQVNERSSHTTPTPHGGGIAIAVTWLVGLVYLYGMDKIDEGLFYALFCGFIVAIVSFLDDLYELSPKVRLLAQSFTAGLGLYLLGGLHQLDLFFVTLDSQLLTNVFAFLMIIWFINLYNFLDGINGYAGLEAIFLAVAGFLLFCGAHFLVLAVAVLGFLFWNYNKAKIFMGDVGSTLLGYNVAVFTIYYANQSSENLWVWIILFGVFWFDATVTLVRRKFNSEKLSQAHKKHAYQRLTQAGWSHLKVTNVAMGLNIVLFIVVYFVPNIAIAFAVSILLLTLSMFFVEKQKRFE
ncbi:MAG: glycosyltransferase family 4 protein [Epsilonproteobacteria bacterium]|nr:glycosyltransferase family 4 protein [Campylobacterota bacterium]